MREGWLSSTDHKVIRYLYLSTAFGFFLAGVTALLLRI
jgi:cytochrome c oxidase subunit 1